MMKKLMKVIREANNAERKRRQTGWKNKCEEERIKTQRVKALITEIKRGRTRKEEIERKLDEIFGKGRHLEIATAETTNKVVERIEEMSKTEEQFEVWEKMRTKYKRKQRGGTEGSTSFGGGIRHSPPISEVTTRHPEPKKR